MSDSMAQALLGVIGSGAADDMLDEIIELAVQRRKVVSAAKALDFYTGDKIRVGEHCSPKYLIGCVGTVQRREGERVVVDFDISRFSNGKPGAGWRMTGNTLELLCRASDVCAECSQAPSMHRGWCTLQPGGAKWDGTTGRAV